MGDALSLPFCSGNVVRSVLASLFQNSHLLKIQNCQITVIILCETRVVAPLHLCNNGARFYISKTFIFLMIHCACTKLSNALR